MIDVKCSDCKKPLDHKLIDGRLIIVYPCRKCAEELNE